MLEQQDKVLELNNRGGLPQGARIKYQVHVQDIGWMDYVYDGADAGTMGRSLRIEAMRMQLENAPAGYHIQYQVHVQDKGWMDTVSDGQLAGTTGESKRIEAFKINLVQDLIPRMNIDAPTEGQNLNSSLRVYRWSLHKGGVSQVKVYVDGNFISNANIGCSRPDVKNAYPSYPNADKSGFEYDIEVAELSNGDHTVTVTTTGNDGSYAQQTMGFNVNVSNSGSVVTLLSLTESFFDGIKDAVSDNLQGISQIIMHPIKSVEMAAFLLVAVSVDGSPYNQMLREIIDKELDEIVKNFKNGDGNLKARYLGRAFGEVMLLLALDKAVEKAFELIKPLLKASKLSDVLEMFGIVKGKKVEAEKVGGLIEEAAEASTIINKTRTQELLSKMPELIGNTREKLLQVIQNGNLKNVANELYRPGATIGDGGTAAALADEFTKGTSTHLQKAQERVIQLKKIINSNELGLNDLDIAESFQEDLEDAIKLFR
ncbi:Ig-like domain-containing protein [Clostridium sp. C8-1-8]|uniref:Ig-like domain-containing protein n=1 Tax=Clostridium sp. C8-1-8 TaxID=2698831 RepID=UPI0013689C0C|nr:Ig-like domain-containing protein [Clostridium sp. C8-1-8]